MFEIGEKKGEMTEKKKENERLRKRIAELEGLETELKRVERAAEKAREYAESIVATVREPLVVLDTDLRVVSVNRSFFQTFKVTPEQTEGQLLYDLGNRQWDIPKLRDLLEEILPENTSVEDFEVEHYFEDIGQRTMLLNARRIYKEEKKTQDQSKDSECCYMIDPCGCYYRVDSCGCRVVDPCCC